MLTKCDKRAEKAIPRSVMSEIRSLKVQDRRGSLPLSSSASHQPALFEEDMQLNVFSLVPVKQICLSVRLDPRCDSLIIYSVTKQ